MESNSPTLKYYFRGSLRKPTPRYRIAVIRIAISCILIFFFAQMSFGQDGGAVRVWFETQNFEEKQVVRAWCQNITSSPLHLKYQADFTYQNQKETKSGGLLASPMESTFLRQASFIFPKGQFDTIRLQVFNKGEKIVDELYLRIPPKKTPPLVEVPNQSKDEIPAPQKNKSVFDAEIDGLVLDETRSKLAHDFYELFYSYWTAENIPTQGHTLTIREMPARIGIGSQVVVEIDAKRLTTLNLQPRAEVVENLAKQLVGALVKHFNDPNNFLDLDSGDLNGSGIY